MNQELANPITGWSEETQLVLQRYKPVKKEREYKRKKPLEEKITGKRFGRLVALNVHHTNEHYEKFYYCVCDCGGESVVLGSSLSRGYSQSCGCLRSELLSKRK